MIRGQTLLLERALVCPMAVRKTVVANIRAGRWECGRRRKGTHG